MNMMPNMFPGKAKRNGKANLNYKIVKCKNWEKDKTCKYGDHCSYAHGEEELRNKADNLYQMNPSFPLMMPIIANPNMNMDMAQMQQFMQNNQFMMFVAMNMNKQDEQIRNNGNTNA